MVALTTWLFATHAFADDWDWGPVSNCVRMSLLARNDAPAFSASDINHPEPLIARLQQHKDEGSYMFSGFDFHTVPALAEKLNPPQRPIDQWLMSRLSPQATNALAAYLKDDNQFPPLQAALPDDFNNIINFGPIFDQERFAGINLRQETKDLMAQNPRGEDLRRLNRLLLEDAYTQIPRSHNTLMLYLWQQSSEAEKTAFLSFRPNGPDAGVALNALADVLNRVIIGSNLWTHERFPPSLRLSGSILSSDAQKLIGERTPGSNLMTLNRLLLEDAYRIELARRLNPNGIIFTNGEPVTLIVSLQSSSPNEEFVSPGEQYEETDTGFHFDITTPSGRLITPDIRRINGRLVMNRFSMEEPAFITFHLSTIFKFGEVGRYIITLERKVTSTTSNKSFTVVSNPLFIRFLP